MNVMTSAILLAVAAICGGFAVMLTVAAFSDKVIVALAVAVGMVHSRSLVRRLGKSVTGNKTV